MKYSEPTNQLHRIKITRSYDGVKYLVVRWKTECKSLIFDRQDRKNKNKNRGQKLTLTFVLRSFDSNSLARDFVVIWSKIEVDKQMSRVNCVQQLKRVWIYTSRYKSIFADLKQYLKHKKVLRDQFLSHVFFTLILFRSHQWIHLVGLTINTRF